MTCKLLIVGAGSRPNACHDRRNVLAIGQLGDDLVRERSGVHERDWALSLHASSDELFGRLRRRRCCPVWQQREQLPDRPLRRIREWKSASLPSLASLTCRSGLTRGSVAHIAVLDFKGVQTPTAAWRPAPSGPAGRGAVRDVAGTDGDHPSLDIIEMAAQHSAISRRQLGTIRHTDHDNLIWRRRSPTFLRLPGQSVYAAKPDKQRDHVLAVGSSQRQPRRGPGLVRPA